MRATDALPDVIVVGAGLIGMLCARELHAAGARVTVVERGECGREASWAGGGILSPLHPWHYPPPIRELAGWSQTAYAALAPELAARTGIDPEWTASGLLVLAGPDERGEAEAWAQSAGDDVQMPGPEVLRSVEPGLGELGERAAFWLPGVAQVRNPRLVRALRGCLVDEGVELREHVEVRGVVAEHGRVRGVATADGPLPAGAVVVAAGAWTARVLAGLEPVPAIEPVRGQMIAFAAQPGVLTRIVVAGPHYLVPRRDGHVLCGSTTEHVGYDAGTTPAVAEALAAAGRALVPALEDVPVAHHWAGLRPYAPRGLPYIGAHPALEGLYVNAGHYRNGVVLAPGSARLLADLVTGREPVVDPGPFRLGSGEG